MPGIVVVGLQWGDEGKGKVVDILSSKADIIARTQGGNNAGHTIVVSGKEHRFHLIPSGVLYPRNVCCVAGGTVIDPVVLSQEIALLEAEGIVLENRLLLSPYAHVIFPFHRELDMLAEKKKGASAIGTTGRGIGPCYVDKAARIGLRLADLIDEASFKEKLERLLAIKNHELRALFGHPGFSLEDIYPSYAALGRKFAPFIAPVEMYIVKGLQSGKKVVFEGAHGSLLDLTFGTYPFVTSCSTFASGVLNGASIGPRMDVQTIGVFKAYTTRVGNGPLPTALSEHERMQFPDARTIREVGTTTGRERRLAWLDIPLLRYSASLSSASCLAMTKLDILDSLAVIKLCTGYRLHGALLDTPPVRTEEWAKIEPVYEEIPGWQSDTSGIRDLEKLPGNARRYLERIEGLLELPISLVSTGPDREQTILLHDLL